MAIATFDTLEYSQTLQSAGMEQKQADAFARAQAQAMAEIQSSLEKQNEASRKELATKGDIQDLRLEMKSIELRITTRLGAMIAASIAIIAALVKWL